jgi:transposase
MERSSYDELLAENVRLRAENAGLRAEVVRLQHQVRQLQARVDELLRLVEAAQAAGKRQAAPFAKKPPIVNPKRPGRKSGREHGTHGHRPPLPDDQIDEEHQALLPDSCPHCQGRVLETHVDHQGQTELPPRPLYRRFHIHCGRCESCGKSVRGRHPLQTSDATGSAASQLGPNAQAAVVYLNKQAGLSHGKVAAVMTQMCQVPLTRGASAQIVLRAGARLQSAYQEIRESIRDSEYLTPDETGWRVGGCGVWLHTAVGDAATCYVIDSSRSADALEDIIGIDWDGVLTHDGWSSYDRFQEAAHQQCLAHVLRRAHNLEERQVGAAKEFPRQVIDLLQESLKVRDDYHAGTVPEEELFERAEAFTEKLNALTARPRRNEANEKLANHLRNHPGCWFSFVVNPDTPATNWKAEQAIRPAVVNRKVWGGNRTAAGATAQAVVMSVIQTCQQQTRSALSFISNALRGIADRLVPSP